MATRGTDSGEQSPELGKAGVTTGNRVQRGRRKAQRSHDPLRRAGPDPVLQSEARTSKEDGPVSRLTAQSSPPELLESGRSPSTRPSACGSGASRVTCSARGRLPFSQGPWDTWVGRHSQHGSQLPQPGLAPSTTEMVPASNTRTGQAGLERLCVPAQRFLLLIQNHRINRMQSYPSTQCLSSKGKTKEILKRTKMF